MLISIRTYKVVSLMRLNLQSVFPLNKLHLLNFSRNVLKRVPLSIIDTKSIMKEQVHHKNKIKQLQETCRTGYLCNSKVTFMTNLQ